MVEVNDMIKKIGKNPKIREIGRNFDRFSWKNDQFSQKRVFLKTGFFVSPPRVLMLLSWKSDRICKDSTKKIIAVFYDKPLRFHYTGIIAQQHGDIA